MKRFLLFLLAVLGLLYLASMGLLAHDAALSRGWWAVQPWLGERPDVVRHERLPHAEAWLVKADDARLLDWVQVLHAEEGEVTDELPAISRSSLNGFTCQQVFTTPQPCRLLSTSGADVAESVRISLYRLNGGYAYLYYRPESNAAGEQLELRAESTTLLLFLCRDVCRYVCLIGPTLLIDAALLLLLPFGARRRRLWYLLPLVYVPVVMLFIGLCFGAQDEATPFVILLACIGFSVSWYGLSLLQSLIFGGVVRLCRALFRKEETPTAA